MKMHRGRPIFRFGCLFAGRNGGRKRGEGHKPAVPIPADFLAGMTKSRPDKRPK
jgi:hypothetical protein